MYPENPMQGARSGPFAWVHRYLKQKLGTYSSRYQIVGYLCTWNVIFIRHYTRTRTRILFRHAPIPSGHRPQWYSPYNPLCMHKLWIFCSLLRNSSIFCAHCRPVYFPNKRLKKTDEIKKKFILVFIKIIIYDVAYNLMQCGVSCDVLRCYVMACNRKWWDLMWCELCDVMWCDLLWWGIGCG